MTTRNQQCPEPAISSVFKQRRAVFGTVIVEQPHAHMRHQMVNAVERLSGSGSQRLRGRNTDHECPGEPGTGGDGNRVYIVEGHVSVCERSFESWNHGIKMRPRSNFGDYPAEPHVLFHRG